LKLLLVDDDRKTASYLDRRFHEAGYAITCASNGQHGLSLAIGEDFDLIIVEWMLPKLDGLTFVKLLRAVPIKTPLLFLSTDADNSQRMAALKAGGDDYLVKPFSFAELLARVTAISGHKHVVNTEIPFKVADLELDVIKRVVKRNGQEIALEPREFHLLEYLLRHAGEVVTRDMLLENVFKRSLGSRSNIVESHLSRLRSKVDKGFSTELIHTVRGVGYCVRAP
jgi:two-component system OmpR family response regulator